MRVSRVLRGIALAGAASLALAACGGGDSDKSLVQRAKDDKSLTIGIKIDQPGIGLQTPGGGYEGFDVDLAKFIAKELGVDEAKIEFKETPSAQRENAIEKGDVDFIVASYSISEERLQKVSFGGPYFLAHQDLLVGADDDTITKPEDLNGKTLCSVKGSTSAQNVNEDFAKEAQLQEVAGYSECLTGIENGTIDALTTDDSILAGYAAQTPGKFKLVGLELSDEFYGVGLRKDDNEGKDAINDAIKKWQDSDEWKKSADKHFGPAEYDYEQPPTIGEMPKS